MAPSRAKLKQTPYKRQARNRERLKIIDPTDQRACEAQHGFEKKRLSCNKNDAASGHAGIG